MNNKTFLRAEDVVAELNVSQSATYKLIRILNNELKEKGFITVQGRVSRKYFEKRIYGIKREEE